MAELFSFVSRLKDAGIVLASDDGVNLRFTCPKGAFPAQLRAELLGRKSEMIAFLAASQAAAAPISMEPRNEGVLLPSWQQESWWKNVQYGRLDVDWINQATSLRLRGPLSMKALEGAFSYLVQRHEVLRTFYVETSGRLIAGLHSAEAFRIEYHALAGCDEARVQAIATELSRLPFDERSDWPIRVHVARLGAEDHVLLFVVNHIISDGVSQRLLLSEFEAAYARCLAGEKRHLAASTLQYLDYAAWQRKWFTDQVIRQHRIYWDGKLSDALLEFPADPTADAEDAHRKVFLPVATGTDLFAKIGLLAQQCKTTRFCVILAAVKVLLWHWCDRKSIVINTVGNLRNREELMGMFGYFSNTNPVVTDLSGNPTFGDVIERVSAAYSDALAHQVPAFLFEEFTRASIYFNYVPAPESSGQAGNRARLPLTASLFPLIPTICAPSGGPRQKLLPDHRLLILLHERQGNATGYFFFVSSTFGEQTVQKRVHQFVEILRMVVSDAENTLASISARLNSDAHDRTV